MKHSPIVSQFSDQTSINLDNLNDYLDAIPNYLEAGLSQGVGRYSLKLLNYSDFFEFALKRYLSGRTKTLHQVFWEIREFRTAINENAANHMIAFSLEAVRQVLLLNEFYELMPRYQQAVKKIRDRFKIDPSALLKEAQFDLSEYLSTT